MRQILTARDVEEMIRRGATVREVPADAIVTPAAQDLLPMLRRVPAPALAPAAVAVPAGPSVEDLLRRVESLEAALRGLLAAQAARPAPTSAAVTADTCGACERGDDAQWRPGATCAPAVKSGGCGCGGACGCGGKCGCGGGAPVVEKNEVAEAMVRQITEMIMKSL